MRYSCDACGAFYPKWSGKCEGCFAWNTISLEESGPVKNAHLRSDIFSSLNDIKIIESDRHKTGIDEFDRVCGGGLVSGSVILVGGAPGIGKSTLMLQVVAALSRGLKCAYISGEEGLQQLKMRANRLDGASERINQDNFFVTSQTNIEDIQASLNKDFDIAIIDSIQTLYHSSIDAAPGSVSQIKSVTQELIKIAKQKNIVILIIGHITKDGVVAGPRLLEHMVDAVFYFDGDSHYDYRILRSFKNRFGPTNEIGVFRMTGIGLEEVKNPSELFLSSIDEQPVSGTALVSTMEGTRPIICEIQVLVASTFFPQPKRTSVGFDVNRLSMLVALLQSRYGLSLSNMDIYLSVIGGFKLSEPACDLAVVAALISALKNKSTPKGAVYFGEVCLSGKVRPAHDIDRRIAECKKLGLQAVFCAGNKDKSFDVKNVGDLV